MKILRGICDGMTALHSENILHLDLKPPNILISTASSEIPWVTDFGLSMVINQSSMSMSAGSTGGAKTGRGTLQYKAPELFRTPRMGGPAHAKAADVYSFSMLAWEVFSGQVPFAGLTESEITTQHIMTALGQEDQQRPILDKVPENMREIISTCWSHDAKDRLTFEEVKELLPIVEDAQQVKREETKTNEYLIAQDGTRFTLPKKRQQTNI